MTITISSRYDNTLLGSLLTTLKEYYPEDIKLQSNGMKMHLHAKFSPTVGSGCLREVYNNFFYLEDLYITCN